MLQLNGLICLCVCAGPLPLSKSLEQGSSPTAKQRLVGEGVELLSVQQTDASGAAVVKTPPAPDMKEVVASQLSVAKPEPLQARHLFTVTLIWLSRTACMLRMTPILLRTQNEDAQTHICRDHMG